MMRTKKRSNRMDEISTRLYKINFKYIIENHLNKALWKKAWLVYDYDHFKVNLRLDNISIARNKITLAIGNTSVDIPLSEDHYNETVFYKSIFSAIKSSIKDRERDAIRGTAAYAKACELDSQNDDKNREIAERRLDELNIDDEEVRKAYIEKYVGENQSQYWYDIYQRFEYSINTPRYLMLAYQFEKECPEYSAELISAITSKFADDTVEEYQARITAAFELIDFEEMKDLNDAIEQAKENAVAANE